MKTLDMMIMVGTILTLLYPKEDHKPPAPMREPPPTLTLPDTFPPPGFVPEASLGKEEAPKADPEFVVNSPGTEPEPLPPDEAEKIDLKHFPSNDEVLSFLAKGKKWSIIMKRTSSFEALYATIRKVTMGSNSVMVMERHFNKAKSKGAGPLLIASPKAMATAHQLLAAYEEIYTAQEWKMTHNRVWNKGEWRELSMTRLADRHKMACIIGEFAFVDDPHQGEQVREFIASAVGQAAIARQSLKVLLESPFDHIVLCAGHWRTDGNYGASSADGYREPEYAFDTFEWMEALLRLERPLEFDNVYFTATEDSPEEETIEPPLPAPPE